MNESAPDSIDLQELAVRIIRYFRNHLKLIAIFCVLGTALGFFGYQAMSPVYESQMVVLSDLLTKTYGDRMDRSLDKLIREQNFAELAAKLNVPVEKVQSIRSIEILCEMDVKSPQRDNVEKDETFFMITVGLTDASTLPVIQEGILNFLRTNEWVKTRSLQREQASMAVVESIDKQLRQLDSLKRSLFQKGQPRTDNIQFDPSMVFTATVELTQLRWKTLQERDLSSSIHLVEGFTTFQKPKEPKLSVMLILGFMLGFLGSIGILTLKHLFTLARN